MSVVNRVSSTANIIKKKDTATISVLSVREPSLLQEMGDTDFGILNASKDNYIVSYNSVTDKFILIPSDTMLTNASEDDDLDDTFIDVIESEIDLGNIAGTSFDGGTF